ncbi:hypothetical protein [Bartonella sp. TS25HLJMH]|uniref:hypothetical protein n=1 Tax=Bartonella sp. TS25HLJMH TaxID=3243576 RepID=UPI0035D0E475
MKGLPLSWENNDAVEGGGEVKLVGWWSVFSRGGIFLRKGGTEFWVGERGVKGLASAC